MIRESSAVAARQNLGDLRSNGLQLGKLNGLRLHRALGRRAMGGDVLRFQRLNLLADQQQPLMLATNFIA